MNKKHVFALSLALFTAAVLSMTSLSGTAEASTRRQTCHVVDHERVCQRTPSKKYVAKKHKTYVAHKATTKKATTKKTATRYASKRTKTVAVAKGTNTYKGKVVNVRPTSGGVIGVADDYIGLTERANRRQLMGLFDFAYNHQIDPARTKWCAAFVNGVLAKSGKKSTGSATAASFLSWGKRTSRPSNGDIVVLSFKGKRASHVGFYMGTVTIKGQRFVKVLGGNQKNSVKVTYYPANRVVQYRTAG